MRKRMTDLMSVTEAAYQLEYQKLSPLLQQEARLLSQIARLDIQVAEVKTQGVKTEGYGITGADLSWHRWESTTRRQLNTELARLRARKLTAMDDLRQAFGRKQALAELTRRMQNDKRRPHGG